MGMLERLELERALEQLFAGKRAGFLEGHGLLSKPALVLQSVPDEPLTIDLTAENVVEALRAGGGPAADDGWWDGLKITGQPNLTFDGLTTIRKSYPEEWASELQVDGSVIVGVWNFPPSASQEPGSVRGVGVADFYTQLFQDFAYLASRVYEAAGYAAKLHVTGTMHLADQLPLVNSNSFVVVPAPKRSTLRWPIAALDGAADMSAIGEAMAAQFMRIYGRKFRK